MFVRLVVMFAIGWTLVRDKHSQHRAPRRRCAAVHDRCCRLVPAALAGISIAAFRSRHGDLADLAVDYMRQRLTALASMLSERVSSASGVSRIFRLRSCLAGGCVRVSAVARDLAIDAHVHLAGHACVHTRSRHSVLEAAANTGCHTVVQAASGTRMSVAQAVASPRDRVCCHQISTPCPRGRC